MTSSPSKSAAAMLKGCPAPEALDLMPLVALCALRGVMRAATTAKALKGVSPAIENELINYLVLVEAATIEARDQEKSPKTIRKVKYSK